MLEHLQVQLWYLKNSLMLKTLKSVKKKNGNKVNHVTEGRSVNVFY